MLFTVQTGFTIDTVIYGIYDEVKGNSRQLAKHTPFGTRIAPADGRYQNYSSTSYFNGDLILYYLNSSPYEPYFFISKCIFFMKYVDPKIGIQIGIEPEKLAFDSNKSILYLDSAASYTDYQAGDNGINAQHRKIILVNGNYYYDDYIYHASHSRYYDSVNNVYRDTVSLHKVYKNIKL